MTVPRFYTPEAHTADVVACNQGHLMAGDTALAVGEAVNPTEGEQVKRTALIIPDTIEGVAGLLTARKWEKAAIVYAWTLPADSGGRPKSGEKSSLYNISEFANLGISGMTDRNTVRLYRNAWVWAIENDWTEPVSPGDEIDLGDLALIDFPPTDQGSYTAKTDHDEVQIQIDYEKHKREEEELHAQQMRHLIRIRNCWRMRMFDDVPAETYQQRNG